MARRGRKVIARRKARAEYAKRQRRLRRRAARQAIAELSLDYELPVFIIWPPSNLPLFDSILPSKEGT